MPNHLFAFFRAALLAAIALPGAAHADTLNTILGVVNGISAYGYNSCAYVSGGVQNVACQANRATNVIMTAQRLAAEQQASRQNRLYRQNQQIAALQRACKAGDAMSCERAGGFSDKEATILSALSDACASGDSLSCRRAEGMFSARQSGLAPGSRTSRAAPAAPAAPIQFVIINGRRCAVVGDATRCFD